MRVCSFVVATVVLVVPSVSTVHAAGAKKGAAHVMLAPDAIKWGPFPPGGPGAEIAVLSGNPQKEGPFVIRIRTPAGSRVPPHWHPTDEHVTVIEGPVGFGMGEKFDETAGREYPVGSYVFMPKTMRHFAWNKGEAIVQVHGMGPFKVIFVNPADDPSRAGRGPKAP
jgi:quercetin dioxygenase-like cupin family protein